MSQVSYVRVVCSCGELSEPCLEEVPYTTSAAGHDEKGNYFSKESTGVLRNRRCQRCGELVVNPEHSK